MERVEGIGGIFFRARNPQALAKWYEDNLGITNVETGGPWTQQAGMTVFSPFPADTDYFGTDQHMMLNFRVGDLDAMLAQLRAAGAATDDKIVEESYGRFGYASDPEGNRFELWQPLEPPAAVSG